MARWVDGVLDAVEVGPVNLVVHDFGGVFGLAWAVTHPDRVRSVAITKTLFHADYRWHIWARIWRTPGLGEFSMAMFNVPIIGRASARLSLKAGSRKLSFAEIDRMYDEWPARTRAAVLRLYRATNPDDFADLGAKNGGTQWSRAVTGAMGYHDPYIPKRFAVRFAREVVDLPECGHSDPLRNRACQPAVAAPVRLNSASGKN